MNTEQLYDLVSELVEDEDREKIQSKLDAVVQSLANLAGSPQEISYQTAVASSLESLSDALNLTYTPLTINRMRSIGADEYFQQSLVDKIRESMAENPMSPAVAQGVASTLRDSRANAINSLRNAKAAFEDMGLDGENLEEGDSEIGFEIPRALFNNELEGFSRELHELRLIIRAFSEIAGNAGERIELRQVSSSDPLIYVSLGYLTVLSLGQAVKWCLDQWKTIEEIRNLRASTANLTGIPMAEELTLKYDQMIDQLVETKVREEAERLAKQSDADEVRENELANHLAKALTGLLARIERGMKVDIRLLPPESTGDGSNADAVSAFESIEAVRDELVFPSITEGKPVLKIEKQPERKKKGRNAVTE